MWLERRNMTSYKSILIQFSIKKKILNYITNIPIIFLFNRNLEKNDSSYQFINKKNYTAMF